MLSSTVEFSELAQLTLALSQLLWKTWCNVPLAASTNVTLPARSMLTALAEPRIRWFPWRISRLLLFSVIIRSFSKYNSCVEPSGRFNWLTSTRCSLWLQASSPQSAISTVGNCSMRFFFAGFGCGRENRAMASRCPPLVGSGSCYKGALWSSGVEIQTDNCIIYNINEVIIQT